MIAESKAHFYKQFVKLRRSSGEWEWMLIYPLVHIFTTGFLIMFLQQLGTASNAAVYMLVGAFSWNIYVLCQKGITYGMLPEIWSESAKHMVTTPATVRHFIMGNGAYGAFTALISLALMHIVALFIFSFNIFAAGAALPLALFGILLYGIAEGLIVSAVMMLKGPEYMNLTWIITGIVMVLSAVYYPLELLPKEVQAVSYLLPTTHAIQSIRSEIISGNGMASGMISIAIGFIYLAMAAFVYTKAIDRSRQNGVILRL